MAKTLDIDLSDDRLISIAADLVDSHDYLGALKMLNKNRNISGDDEDSLMLYAEIFDDLGLYEKSVNGWFRYLDLAEDTGDLSDCYEGLAVGYMNLGNEHYSAYYYNKLLMETGELDEAARNEIIENFMSEQDNPLKFAYPPALADCSEIFSDGIAYMRNGEYEKAVEEFDKIEDGNPRYLDARNYIAMCAIIADKTEEAEQECRKILEKHPDDVQALSTLTAVMGEKNDTESARSLAEKLLTIEATETDDIYKIATVCCENGMHEEALKTFKKLPPDMDFDLNVLYFRAVAAFNCGKYDECLDTFDRLCTLYPEAVTAAYWYRTARRMIENGENKSLSYFYRMPPEMRESSLKIMAAYMNLSAKAAKKLVRELDLSLCVAWCFDECDYRNGGELQTLAGSVAVKADMDEVVRDLLLNAFVDERIKLNMLSDLAMRNRFDFYSVVVCNVLRRVTTQFVDIGRKKRKIFLQAYARLFSGFAVIDDSYSLKFADAAESVYKRLEKSGRLDEATDLDVLTVAICVESGVHPSELAGESVYEFYGVDKEKVARLLDENN